EVVALHRVAVGGGAGVPLQPRPAAPPMERAQDLDEPEADLERLLFLCKQLLEPLLQRLAGRDGRAVTETLRPAAPTLDGVQVLGLLHLRLEALSFSTGVVRVALAA